MKKMRIRKAGMAFLLAITMLISTNGVALCANTSGTSTTGSVQKSNLGNLLSQDIEKYNETPSQKNIEEPILKSDKGDPVKEVQDIKNTENSVEAEEAGDEEIEVDTVQSEIEGQDQNNLNRESREVNVSTSEELQAALSNAQPGDEIILAPGEYLGITPLSNWAWFYSAKNGTQESPITVRSADPGNKAVLKGAGTLSQASVLRIRNADYWIIKDIVCANAQRGITLDASNYSQIIGCEVHTTGSEGIQIRDNSSHNLVESCKVTNTGQVSPGFGEGIYIGSYYGDWTKYGKECDFNTVRGCYLGPGVAAEHVDIKEGTTGNVVEYCVFDATGMSGQNYADSFVDLQGNDATIRYNIGYRNDNPSFNAAFQVHRMVSGWGINNIINGNEVWLDNQIPYLIDSSQSGTSAIVEIPNIRHPETGNKYLGNVTEVQTTTIDIEVKKIWEDENNQDGKRPINVQIQLYKTVDGTKSAVGSAVLNESNSWSNKWNNLPEKESGKTVVYSVEEVKIPIGYTVNYTDDGAGNLTITNSYTPEKTTVEGQKTWVDQDNQDGKRPSYITVNLLANGNKVTSQLVEETDNWGYEFKDLPKYEDGDLITYTITEDAVSGYTTQINGTNITNTYAPSKTSRTVTKVWNDSKNQDGKRPEDIQVQLYKTVGEDKSKVGETETLSAGNSWSHTWNKLPEMESGHTITYSVEEVKIPTGYTVNYADDGAGNLTITNSYEPEKTTVAGQKTWVDQDNQDGKRPSSITVNLLANGNKVSSQLVEEADNWSYEFKDLPKYEAGKLITYTITEDAVSGYTTKVNGTNLTNTYAPSETSRTVTKVWNDNKNQDGKRPEDIQVQLYKTVDEVKSKVGDTETLNSGNSWSHTWSKLPEMDSGHAITYSVEEVDVPTDYIVSYADDGAGNLTVTNSYTPEKTTVAGQKTWVDQDNQDGKRPSSITVNLLANGNKVSSQLVDETDNWSYEFKDLPKYEAGKLITYTITEDAVSGYTTQVNGTNLTNTYAPSETSRTVTKVWNDSKNQDGNRPEVIQVQLYKTVDDIKSKIGDTETLSAGNSWTHTWSKLPEMDSGHAITYSVEEVDVATDYIVSYADDGAGNLTVTNSYTPEKTTVAGHKTWMDQDNQDGKRPLSITVNLLANGNKVSSLVVEEKDNWSYKFKDLPKYEDGDLITYTVTEDAVSGYTTQVNGTNLTNTYAPSETSRTVTKVWNDSKNQDGKRPKDIQVQLYKTVGEDKSKVGETETLSAGNSWCHTWNKLPEMESGHTITYSVEEEKVPSGYTVNYADDGAGNLTITNSYTPEKITVAGQKTWVDQDNQDGKRPTSITVNLLANGNKVSSLVVGEADNWSYEFKDLPKYEDEDLITYTVTEDAVSGYTTQINGANLTNTYAPSETSRTVTKVWNDSKNQDGKRPDDIQVQLYKTVGEDKSKVGEAETLSAGNNWTHTWSGLPEMESGHIITYSVEEVKVPAGYTVNYTDDGVGNITIINSYTLETTNKSVQIVWDDEKNQDGKRPMSMNVQLLAEGVEKGDPVILNAANNWEYTWTGLDKYQTGQEIVYTLKEISMIDGYLTSYSTDTFTITNSHIPEVVEKEVSKVWDDADNQNGKRPDSIEVQLLTDGIESGGAVTLDASNHWKHTFVGLDKYKAGQEIAYTMIEKTNTAEYSTTYSSDTFTITNSYTPRETSKTVINVWDDADNQDGKRPASIEVQLFADGVESGAPITLGAENNWRYTWTGLPEAIDGRAINYTVKEISIVEGYSVTYSVDTFTITNSYRPETVVQSVSKVWADNNNESGKRPESIKVQLFVNGEVHGENITLSKTNNWKHTWTELDKFENGVLIHYTVKEIEVSEHYIMSKEEKAEETIITNTYRKSAAASDDKTDSKTAEYINKHVANTGDETNILNLFILLILSGGILTAVGIRRKRKSKVDKK